jgi:short-subunit dehydrogenase
MKKSLIIGATSAIAEQTARLWAEQGHQLFLLARNKDRLGIIAADLKLRGAESVVFDAFDFNEVSRHFLIVEQVFETMGTIDQVLIAHGSLADQKSCEGDVDETLKELNTNAISVISFLTCVANRMEKQGDGTIAVISSVAGDRGRKSNYIYGTAKGAVSIFLQGLRNRLFVSGVRVLTIKPGFVDTPMTHAFQKGLLWATPEQIAADIEKGIKKKRDVMYTPWFWRYIMLIICLIPERFFKRLSL